MQVLIIIILFFPTKIKGISIILSDPSLSPTFF